MSSTTPTLSVILPWRDRPELGSTLRQNAPLLNADQTEIVVVNCGGDSEALRGLLTDQPYAAIRWVDVQTDDFNKPTAQNLGVSVSQGEYLFFLDTDIVLKDDCIPQALELLQQPCFVSVDRVFESEGGNPVEAQLREVAYSVEFTVPNERKVRIETNRVRFHEASRSAPGLTLLRREHFLQVNGTNSELKGRGWEDLDLLARLQLALGLSHRTIGAAIHLTHSDAGRHFAGRSRLESEQENFAICLTNYSLGLYQGSYREDVAAWKDRMLVRTLENNA